MAVIASELIAYGCANHAEDDVSTQGGAIDTSVKVGMVFLPYSEPLEAFSSSGSDTTQTVTVTGRLTAGGAITTEVITLSGTDVIRGVKTWERVLKLVMSATAVGTVTVRGDLAGPTVATLEPGITDVRTFFYDSPVPGGAKSMYEKFFFKNTNATESLLTADLTLTVEPTHTADFLMAVEDAVDDSNSSATRIIAPTGLTVAGFVQKDVSEGVPGGTLAAGEVIGVWIQADLADGNVALVDGFSVKLLGTG